jgi:hypothetical protein
MNKITKTILRIWITVSALVLFGIGWVALAHAQKPASLADQFTNNTIVVETVDLAPVLSLEELAGTTNRPVISQPSVNINIPRMRTRGS